jgi:DNA (cytosine-5)-methyltransferase 1
MIVDKKQKTVCFGFDPGASRDVGVLFLEEVSKTISNGTCPGHHNGVVLRKDVGEMQNEKVNGTRQAKQGQNLNSNNVCRSGSVVRRLTPMECERLQGFPDGWTDIGEWVDSKGKKHKEADSPRYKALGNSIALPFWQWMAKRISAQYERTPTMASLFDGIGGFPLVFARAGTIPVWASEIEEFPIAVTKIRFPEEEQL